MGKDIAGPHNVVKLGFPVGTQGAQLRARRRLAHSEQGEDTLIGIFFWEVIRYNVYRANVSIHAGIGPSGSACGLALAAGASHPIIAHVGVLLRLVAGVTNRSNRASEENKANKAFIRRIRCRN
jgi:hypothetical protein